MIQLARGEREASSKQIPIVTIKCLMLVYSVATSSTFSIYAAKMMNSGEVSIYAYTT